MDSGPRQSRQDECCNGIAPRMSRRDELIRERDALIERTAKLTAAINAMADPRVERFFEEHGSVV